MISEHKDELLVMVMGVVLLMGAVLGFLVNDLTNTAHRLDDGVNESNARLELGRLERTELQYQDMLLGCNSAGVQESDHPAVRELCDKELPRMYARLVILRRASDRADLEEQVNGHN